MIEQEIMDGRKVIGYGASARSSTLLNFCGLDQRHLTCIADQNQLKHNYYTPGTNIRVTSPADALSESPDTIVILAWNFKDEIIEDLRARKFTGKLIIPLPNTAYTMSI